MKIEALTRYLETIAPLSLQESYDNAELIVGDPSVECTGVLLTLDAIEEVVDEAVAKGCNLIVAHHPIVFSGLKKLNGRTYIERTVIKALRNEVAIYAIHTNLDNVATGVNRKIAERLGLHNCRILLPSPVNAEVGAGMIGELPEAVPTMDFLQSLKQTMQTDCVRHTRVVRPTVQRIAVCGGAGSFLLPKAIAAGADVLVTDHFKYHQFFDADGHLVIADIGHYESEQFTPELLRELLYQKFRTFAPILSDTRTNPINYL